MDHLIQYSSDTSDEEEEQFDCHIVESSHKRKEEGNQQNKSEDLITKDHQELINTLVPYSQNYSQHKMKKVGGYLYIPWRPQLVTISQINRMALKTIKQMPYLRENMKFKSTNVLSTIGYHMSASNNFLIDASKIDNFRNDIRSCIRDIELDERLLGFNVQEAFAQQKLHSLFFDDSQVPSPAKYINLKFENRFKLYFSDRTSKLFIGSEIDSKHYNSDSLTHTMKESLETIIKHYDEDYKPRENLELHVSFQVGDHLTRDINNLREEGKFDKVEKLMKETPVLLDDIIVNVNELVLLIDNEESEVFKFSI
ncbi:uncharacterized protein RJT21DRAFT_119112 [Scheffersomyces amazonensis]|uniref:uncharacterized protein n=1 Tax=Scheffersomyces amazonensis TaxID=1078765 RepID=UPI00315D578D